MKTIHLMRKPASSLCNMRCGYCFYSDVAARRNTPSCGLMSDTTAEAIVSRLGQDLEPGDHIHFAFQGGEPTLAGLSWDYWDYNEFCKNRQIKVHYGLYFETQS